MKDGIMSFIYGDYVEGEIDLNKERTVHLILCTK